MFKLKQIKKASRITHLQVFKLRKIIIEEYIWRVFKKIHEKYVLVFLKDIK
jgi:hypothetical protein